MLMIHQTPSQRGHLLGAAIGGSNSDIRNFVNETSSTNIGQFGNKIERYVRKVLDEGYGVVYQVIAYGDSKPANFLPGSTLCTPRYLKVAISVTDIKLPAGLHDFPIYFEYNGTFGGRKVELDLPTVCDVGIYTIPNIQPSVTFSSMLPSPSLNITDKGLEASIEPILIGMCKNVPKPTFKTLPLPQT